MFLINNNLKLCFRDRLTVKNDILYWYGTEEGPDNTM